MVKKGGLPGWRDMQIGNIVTEPGSASAYCTGDWRSQRPVRDLDKCVKCGLCWLYCPEAAYSLREDGYFDLDLFYCKGCGICAAECKKGVITMEEEEE
ncbi:MAG: 4Fe-4S binding protein [Chloroflexota bacterium]|nr:4Fe-4S binding protein [Chloroflexota bacterium]